MRLWSWITYEDRLKPSLSDLTYRKEITAVCTLLKNGNRMTERNIWARTSGLFQILTAKGIWNSKISNGVIDVMMRVYNETRIKVVPVLYQNLKECRDTSVIYIKAK